MADAGSAADAFFDGASVDGRARYSDVQLIGQGAYSVVARAIDKQKNIPVAIKRISEVFYDAHEAKKVLREIRLLRDFRHPNIIWLHALVPPASMETFNDLWIVTDYMDGDLRRIIKSKKEIEPMRVKLYMAQLLAALHHVHALDSIHRDLKPANVLASRKGNLKLCDFGLARTMKQNHGTEVENEGGAGAEDPSAPVPLVHQMTNYVVTRWYRAPEVILQQPYGVGVDVWAAGCIYKELLELMPGSRFKTGALFPGRYCIPFSFDDDHKSRHRHDQLSVICRVLSPPIKEEMAWADEKAQKEVSKICGGFRDMDGTARASELTKRLSEACPIAAEAEIALLGSMLSIDPTKRPVCKAALGHEYFSDLPEQMRPPVSEPNKHEGLFSFEQEKLDMNDLRILIANDLFRLNTEGKTPPGDGAAAPA